MDKKEVATAKESAPRELGKLDLKKYRTGELTEQLTELISIPGAVFKVIVTALQVVSAAAGLIIILTFFTDLSGLLWLGLSLYLLLIALVIGLALGLLRVAYRSLGNIEAILCLIFDIAENVAVDSEQLQSGQVRPPTGSELIAQVFDDVVAPTLQKVLRAAFGLFGWPMYLIYHGTINKGVRMVLKRVEPELSEEQDAAISQGFESGVVGSSKYSQHIKVFTERAAGVVGAIGVGIRSYIMRPVFIVFCVLVFVAFLPALVVLIWHLRSWGIPAEELIEDQKRMMDAVSTFWY